MAKRKVFGRRRIVYEDKTYIIEMREDALYVHKLYGRDECPISFARIAGFAKPQLELDPQYHDHLDTNEPQGPLPNMPQGLVVRAEPGEAGGDLHASCEPTIKDLCRRPSGVSPPAPGTAETTGTDTESTATNHQLPGANPEVG